MKIYNCYINNIKTKGAFFTDKDFGSFFFSERINKELEINSKYQSQINDLKSSNDLEKINNKNNIEILNLEHERKIQNIKQEYDNKISSLNNNILGLQRQRATMGSKMIGEDLEVWCTNEYLSFAQTGGLSNCVWTKDNIPVRYADEVHASKGDFILNCYATDEHKEETLLTSIIFEMKNESDETATKHKNEDFFKELDKDRKEKKCEYAVLVSLLEKDNDYYNAGIVDVSHKYEKMYVIRPQSFISIINILRNSASKTVDAKRELIEMQNQNIDIAHFEENMNNFKDAFSRNFKLASDKFDNAIDEIDKTMQHLQKIKDSLLGSKNQLRLANDKAEDLSIKKLTDGSPSIAKKFEEIGVEVNSKKKKK